MSTPRIVLSASAAAFAAGLAALAQTRHLAFWSGRFDLGNLTQAVWSTAHGHFLEMTDLQGRQISRLGAHFDPIVAAFAPLWRIWPSPTLLLTTQALAIAAGAFPVFLLARKHLDSEWAGAGCAVLYLLYPATQWLGVDDFHPVAFATPLLLAGFWFLDEDRLLAFGVVATLACLTKEQMGLTVAAMGVWYAMTRRKWRAGGIVAVAGVAVSVVAVAVVVPHFAPGGGSPFEGRYTTVGGSPSGIAHTLVTHPGRIASAATQWPDLRYLTLLLVPLALLPLLGWNAALTAAPELVLNVLSDTKTQTSIDFHYTAGLIPGLVVGAVFGIERLRRIQPRVGRAAVRTAVAIGAAAAIGYGPVPLWSHVPVGDHISAYQYRVTARDRVAEHAIALVPARAAVSVTNTIGAHMSARRRVFSFPLLLESRWVVVDTLRMSYGDDNLAHAPALRALRTLRRDSRWHLVFARKGIVVLHRGG